MYSAMGHWPSFVNPKRENLFKKNGIDSCFLIKDEYDKIVGHYCRPFLELWKVRFSDHPYDFDSKGWSHGSYKPSQMQMEYLYTEYELHNVLTDYIYGENLYKLLRDVRRDSWIENYSTIAKDSINLDLRK